jgi:hypothetical protein
MQYAQRDGYTPAGQQRREQARLEVVGRFARGDSTRISRTYADGADGAAVTAWRGCGAEIEGPVSWERMSPQRWARLELELGKGRCRMGWPGTRRGRWAGSRR